MDERPMMPAGQTGRAYATEEKQHGPDVFETRPFALPEKGYTVATLLDEADIEALAALHAKTTPEVPSDYYVSAFGSDIEVRRKIFEGIVSIVEDKVRKLVPGYRILMALFATKKANGAHGLLPIHQDYSLVDHDRHVGINIWIPLVDTHELNGQLRNVDFSPRSLHISACPPNPAPCDSVCFELEAGYLTDTPIKRGNACVFDTRVLHTTEPNRTDIDRTAVILNLIPDDAVPRMYFYNPKNSRHLEIYEVNFEFLLHVKPNSYPEDSVLKLARFVGMHAYDPKPWTRSDLRSTLSRPSAGPTRSWPSLLLRLFSRPRSPQPSPVPMTTETSQDSPIRDARAPLAAHSLADVKRYYEEKTSAYLEGFGEVFQGSRPASTSELLDYIIGAAELTDGLRILDAGCGVCGPSIYFAQKRQLAIEAVTISPTQVKEAQKRIRARKLNKRIVVREGDFHHLAEIYEPNSFDRVLFLETICHARDYRTVIEQTMRILKPGGLLYIKDFYCQDFRSKPNLIEQQLEDLRALNRVYCLVLPDLVSLLGLVSELGFALEYLRKPGYNAVFEPWINFDRVAGVAWTPKLPYFELIAGVELCCRKPIPPAKA